MQQMKLPLLLTLALASMTAFGQLKIDVKKGQKFKVETSTKVTSSAEVMGQSMENNINNTSTTTYEVLDVESSEIKLESKLTRMVAEASGMGQTSNYDSDKKDNEGPLADLYNGMVNKANTVKLDNKGTITKQDAPESNASPMKALGGGNESTIDLFIPALAGKLLKVGESYPDISETKSEKYNSRDSGYYKVTDIKDGVASISYSGTQAVSTVMEQMGMEMTVSANNIIKTELQLDINTGRVLVKASVLESNSTIEAGGMSIPATGKTITTVTITALQ